MLLGMVGVGRVLALLALLGLLVEPGVVLVLLLVLLPLVRLLYGTLVWQRLGAGLLGFGRAGLLGPVGEVLVALLLEIARVQLWLRLLPHIVPVVEVGLVGLAVRLLVMQRSLMTMLLVTRSLLALGLLVMMPLKWWEPELELELQS